MKLFPNEKQMEGKSTCGPVCLLNIYNHFGIDTDLKKILDGLEISDKKATYPAQLALHLKNNGLKTLVITSSPRTVAPNWKALGQELLKEKLKLWIKVNNKNKWVKNARHVLRYLSADGELLITDLTTNTLDEYIDKGYLMLCCLEESWIWEQRKIKNKIIFDDIKGQPRGHFVLVYGKEGNEYLVSDPYPTGLKNKDGLYRLNKDKLLVAILVWSATVVAVKK